MLYVSQLDDKLYLKKYSLPKKKVHGITKRPVFQGLSGMWIVQEIPPSFEVWPKVLIVTTTACWAPPVGQSALLCVLFIIFTMVLLGKYCPHFADEGVQIRRGLVT